MGFLADVMSSAPVLAGSPGYTPIGSISDTGSTGAQGMVYKDAKGKFWIDQRGVGTLSPLDYTPQHLQQSLSGAAAANTQDVGSPFSQFMMKNTPLLIGAMAGGAGLAGDFAGLTGGAGTDLAATDLAGTGGTGAFDSGALSGINLDPAAQLSSTVAGGGGDTTLLGSGVTDESLLTANPATTGFSGQGSGPFGMGVPNAGAFSGVGTTLSNLVGGGGAGGSAPGVLGSAGNLAQGITGLVTAGGLNRGATANAAAADPFGPYRAQYAQQLNQLTSNPNAVLPNTPGYQAGIQAVERAGASQGWTGSGNMMKALQDFGGNFYQQQLNNLMTLSGASFNNSVGAANIAQTGQTNAAQLLGNSLNPLIQGTIGLARALGQTMADFSAFSNLPGTQFDANAQALRLGDLTNQKVQGEIAAQPAHLELLKAQINDTTAQARERSAKAESEQLQLEQQKLATQIFKRQAADQQQQQQSSGLLPGGLDPYDMGMQSITQELKTANELVAGGAYVPGMAMRDKAIGELQKLSAAQASKGRSRVASIDAGLKHVQLVERYLGNATSPAEFEAGKAAILSSDPNMPQEDKAALMQMQYSPEMTKHIRDSAVSEKERRDLEIKKLDQEGKERLRGMRSWAMKWDRSIAGQQQKADIESGKAAAKAGAAPMKDLNPKFIARTKDELSRTLFPGKRFDELDQGVRDELESASLRVAGDAQSLMRANRGMNETEARTRAIAKERVDWQKSPSKTLLGVTIDPGKLTHVPNGKSAETAAPLPPPGMKGVENKYYMYNGAPHQLRGGKLYPAARKAPKLEVPDEAAIDEPEFAE